MIYSKQTLRGAFGLVAILALGGAMAACSEDNPGEGPSGTGGSGTGGKASGGSAGKGSGGATSGGAGGKMTGGAGGATGGTGGKATGGSGGKATGGSGGRVPDDGGPDADGGCHAPQSLVFDKPGCGASIQPICAGPAFDACAQTVCACDGETITGCGNYEKRWAHLGPCTDGGDGGPKTDAGDGG